MDEVRRVLAKLGPLRWGLKAVHHRRFLSFPGQFYGVYPDFAAAARAVPVSRPVGYDSEPMAGLYREELDRIYLCDYPVMFWLRPMVQPGLSVFDVGGHVGLAFYAYRDRLLLPEDFAWTVQDVAAVVRAGTALAAERGEKRLQFSERLADADGSDVLIAAGSLQYIEAPLAHTLSALERPPRFLLLHKLPLTDGPAFVTLQNTVYSFNPYHVFNRKEFIGSFEALGYRLVDTWDDLQRSCILPYAPERSVLRYSGVYLQRAG
jgi:putative methyltransferase (TIGR04325 family)